MDAQWQIRLLGMLSAQHGDIVLSRFATSRVAALMARLALFPHRAHSREELAGVLWPDADVDAGRLNLRVALLSLRRQMEPPGTTLGSVLTTDRNSIRLSPYACVCDVTQFEAALRAAARATDSAKRSELLHQAVDLYAGELMPCFYDEWILDERDRLQALFEEAKSQCDSLPPPKPGPAPAVDFSLQYDSPRREQAAPLLGFPGQFTRFFGRVTEKAQLTGLLRDPAVRLVSLLGPGGAGKTRLALETAREAAEGFDGEVCFVPLADISDSTLIASAIASALRLALSGDRPPLAQVASHFASSQSLLILDNLEHLGEGGASEIHALLSLAPPLTCLVTSRQKLGIEGEQEVLLSPLPVPLATDDYSKLPLHSAAYPSIQLFVDRAQAVRADFQITPGNAEAVAAVCRSLEGMPLALELAAARIQALTPGQMRQQLDARLDFLTSRRRDLPPRHRSLRAALEWSTHLLTPEQTRFFAQLSVFRGGWTLEAANAVCEVPASLDLLEQLCERSLLATEESPLGMRFRLLESMREFGEEQLTPGEKQAVGRRHAVYFQQLTEQMGRLWYSPQQILGLETLTAEYDNLRAALTFCRTDPPDGEWDGPEIGLRLAAGLGDYWTTRGMMLEGIDWLEGALAVSSPAHNRRRALTQVGWLAAGISDFERAEPALSEAVALSRSQNDQPGLVVGLRLRGTALIWKGSYTDAQTDLEEALTLCRALGDEQSLAITLNSLGVLANEWRGDNETSRVLYEEALPLFLKLGDQQRASYCLHNLGNIAHDDGDFTRAISMLQHSLSLADALGDTWHRAYCLRSLGDVYMALSSYEEAAKLMEEGCTLCRRLGDRMTEAGTRLSLAKVRRCQRLFPQAEAEARAALLLYRAVERPSAVAESWRNLAETAAAQEKWTEVAALLSAAQAVGMEFSNDAERTRHESLHQKAHAAAGQTAFDAAWTRGRTLTCDEYGLRSA